MAVKGLISSPLVIPVCTSDGQQNDVKKKKKKKKKNLKIKKTPSVRAGLKVSLSLLGCFFGVQLSYRISMRQHMQHGQTGTPVIVACKNETPLTPLLSFTKVHLEICT